MTNPFLMNIALNVKNNLKRLLPKLSKENETRRDETQRTGVSDQAMLKMALKSVSIHTGK